MPPVPLPPWHPSGLSRRCALSWTRCASTLSNTTRQVQEAKGRPHAFGDALVARIVQGHTDQREDHWLFEHQRRGTTNAMVLAACGCTPPAAGSCGLWSRHATRRQAARLWKVLGTAPSTLIAIRWPWKDAQKAQKDHILAGCERSGGGPRIMGCLVQATRLAPRAARAPVLLPDGAARARPPWAWRGDLRPSGVSIVDSRAC